MRCTAAIFILSLSAPIALAQQASVRLELGTTALEVGEATSVQLICTNTGQPESPRIEVPAGVKLTVVNPSYSSMHRTQFVNRRRSSQTTYTLQMRLVGVKAGTYLLDSITVKAGKRTYTAEPAKVLVKEPANTDTDPGDLFLFADITVEPSSLYVTQSYTATLRIGMRRVIIDNRLVNVDLVRDLLDRRASQFSLFAEGATLSRSDSTLSSSDGQRHRYEILRLTKTLRAEEVGDLRIGPVFIRINYPTAIRRTTFGGYRVSRSRPETARADAKTVTVLSPPMADRPDDYSGAIGQYTLVTQAKPNRVRQGEPITLTLRIRGEPLQGLAGPDLSTQADLVSRFDFASDELVGDVNRRAKIFRRAIFPKQAGPQTVPPISWSYFDPELANYVTLRSLPIDLVVDPAAVTAVITIDDPTSHTPNETKLKILAGGISPNYTDPDRVLSSQRFAMTTPWLTTLIAAPVLWVCLLVTTGRRQRLRLDVNYKRRRRAYRSAKAILKHAMREQDPPKRLHRLGEALTQYLSDRLGLPPGELTPRDISEALSDRDLAPEFTQGITSFLASCATTRYAPSATGDDNHTEAVAHVREWMRRIERATR